MIAWLDPAQPPQFPDTRLAQQEPNGLLAAGGSLNIEWLLAAYRRGIFPWFNENEPILWWTPAPRTVLFPEQLHISRSFRKFLKKSTYRISRDQRFSEVMQACAEPRPGQPGSWISPMMEQAYGELFEAGHAHSWECWDENDILVGGLYGVTIGQVFFGESMFSRAPNASKCCLKALVDTAYFSLIDCQMNTPYLISMGAQDISREEFEVLLQRYTGSLAD
jgi:leucyl/phenylalanyl-tRNA--protein transferase